MKRIIEHLDARVRAYPMICFKRDTSLLPLVVIIVFSFFLCIPITFTYGDKITINNLHEIRNTDYTQTIDIDVVDNGILSIENTNLIGKVDLARMWDPYIRIYDNGVLRITDTNIAGEQGYYRIQLYDNSKIILKNVTVSYVIISAYDNSVIEIDKAHTREYFLIQGYSSNKISIKNTKLTSLLYGEISRFRTNITQTQSTLISIQDTEISNGIAVSGNVDIEIVDSNISILYIGGYDQDALTP